MGKKVSMGQIRDFDSWVDDFDIDDDEIVVINSDYSIDYSGEPIVEGFYWVDDDMFDHPCLDELLDSEDKEWMMFCDRLLEEE